VSGRTEELRARLELALPSAVVDALEELVAELVEERLTEASVAGTSPWLAVDESAAYLGVSERTLQRMIKRGRVGSTKIGRRRLLRREDLDGLAKTATGEDVAPTTSPRRRR
jgi:excisionase family DNA binding protein